MPGRDRLVGFDDLHQFADPVVHVPEFSFLQVKGMTAEAGALREDHAASFRRLDLERGGDGVFVGRVAPASASHSRWKLDTDESSSYLFRRMSCSCSITR